MPSVELGYSNPFGHGFRPYLILTLTGINQASGNVIGLLDTGADTTAIPQGYAALMGYGTAQLDRIEVGTAAGSAYGWKAMTPCTAAMPGAESVLSTHLMPTFISSGTPLWGRGDVMRMFAVTIEDAEQRFTLNW